MSRLLIAVGILAVVLGFMYWPSKKAAPAAAKPLVTFSNDDVQQIDVTQPGLPTVEVQRAGTDWKMVQPYAFTADAGTVSGMLSSLGGITDATDMGAGAKPATFGLDSPSVVKLTMKTGKTLDFEFGADSPTGGNSYLAATGTNIKMVPSYIKESAIKPAFGYQDKSILKFPEDKVTGMEIVVNGKKVELARKDGNWPKDQQQDAQSLLDAVANGQMTAMLDPSGKTADKYGLSHPNTYLRVAWPDGSGELDFGTKKGAAEYYARSGANPAIFTISDFLFTDLNNLASPSKTSTAK